MKLTPRRVTGLPLWLQLGLICTVGLLIAGTALFAGNRLYRQSLVARANTVAASLDTREVAVLQQPQSVYFTAAYDDIKAKLTAVKHANEDVAFVYLMGTDAQKGVYFLADSETPGSDGYSPNGQAYPEASKALTASFSTKRSFIEGPVRDRWGTWLSALAPLRGSDGTVVAMAGMDVPAGTYFWLLALAGGVPLAATLLTMGILYNRTKLRRKQTEALQFRSELMSIASHELRSPLAGLRWSEELIMRAELEQTVRRAMEIMHDSTLKLQESIEDVMQLAALESGKQQLLELKDIDIKQLIQGIFAMQQLAADQHEIHLEFAADWPASLVISCDERRLKRVFHNLISNAIKYGKPGTPVTIGYKKSGGSHVITVTDHGIGIPKSEQNKVFSGFYRATNAREHAVTGTGMGLYLSRTILHQHGGTISLASAEGEGTTVTIMLPVARKST